MTEALTLSQAAERYLAKAKNNSRAEAEAEVGRFVRWYGENSPVAKIQGHDIFLYAESLGPATPEVSRRAEHVRSFLSFLKKEGFSSISLASNLRLRRASNASTSVVVDPGQPLELTAQGLAALEEELAALKGQRPVIAEELRLARQDKDFRENAPLDAAREKQGHLEARIRNLESRLKRAVVVDRAPVARNRVNIGSTVVLRNLANGSSVRYTIVSPSEANLASGKLSSASPVGKALMERREGEELNVSAPAGELRFKVEKIS
ncbi:MAG TPA: transcription elongation factor GreA [Dehalococcoidia bacterium]|nr:transcription elongation factor GreA [Dehalococcoidia bacterium]